MAIYTVATAAQLHAALAKAVGGDRVLLAPGDYGEVRLSNYRYASTVTIQSQKSAEWAHFDGLTISNSTNLQFSWLDLGRDLNGAAGETNTTQLNWVRNSANIRFEQSRFSGSADDVYGNDGIGLGIYDSTNVRVAHSEFSDLDRGIYVLRSNGTQIVNNDIHDIREDGIDVAAATGITIANNLIRNFHPLTGDHADAIQFWNTGQAKGSSNAIIKNNVIWMPEEYSDPTLGVQGIFISAPEKHGYRNLTIENNLIYSNDYWNGLTVNGGTNVHVVGNSVLSSASDRELMWIRLENSSSVVMRNNVTEDVVHRNTAFYTQGNNLDFSVTPTLRGLFANLVDPSGVLDLITPGVGFQMPLAAIGSVLSGGLFAVDTAAPEPADLPVIAQMPGLGGMFLDSFTAIP